jgi:hypothetical protein
LLIALIEHELHEMGVAIDGRAYGNGVAAIYYDHKDL